MNVLESKLKDLNKMLIEDGYNGSNIVIRTLEEIRDEAINYTHSCTELRDEYLQPELDKYRYIKRITKGKSDSEQLFCDCYIKYPRGDGDCRRCGLPAKP